VKLLSAGALGPNSQTTQVHSGTLDLNGQTGITVGTIALNGTSDLVNNNTGTAAGYAGNVTFFDVNTPKIGGAGNITLSGTLSNGGFSKSGAGTLTLSGSNSYTGATSVNAGNLVINGNNSAATGTITVAAGTVTGTPVATLAGSGTGSNGTIGGSVVLAAESSTGFKNGGVLAPTAAASGTKLSVAGTTTFGTGSIFEWDMSATNPASDPGNGEANSGSYGQLAGAQTISGSNAVFKIVLGSGNAFTDVFWNTDKTWNNIFTGDGATNALTSIFSSISGAGITFASNKGTVADQGYFTFSGNSTLNWTAVPEPTSALAGLLITAGLLRRRRA
jgi:autotransporter-associated beta strand protein